MIKKVYSWLEKVEQEYGISKSSQIIDLIASRFTLKLGVSEYFELELFDKKKYPILKNCVGRRISANIDKTLNQDGWRATANDKILNYSLLSHFNFSIPKTIATYRTGNARIDNEKSFSNPEQLHSFFTEHKDQQFFIKPVHGTYGRGTFSLSSYDVSNSSFQSITAKSVSLDEIVSVGKNPNYKGLLIQKRLKQHSAIKNAVGSNISCVRVILIRDGLNTFVQRAFWKIARVNNITDTFSYGKHGNLLADVDTSTGLIKRVITGFWPEKNPSSIHPDTGVELSGFQIPDWDLAIQQCIAASNIFPGLSLQSWDIAFCEDGPVLMELNTEPNLEVPQLLSEKAFIDERLLKILKKHNW